MNRFFVVIAAVPLALAAQQPAGDDGARPIALDEAVRQAQRNAPAAVTARNALRTSAAAVRSAYAQYIPSLSISSSGSRQGGETFFQGKLVPYSGVPWSFSRGLSTNLELFDGGRRWFNLKSAQANVDAADASETSQRYNIALQVKQQYFAVLAARESEAAARKQLEQAQEQLKSSTAKVRAGAATKSDSLRSAIQVGNARLAQLTAQNNLRVANAALSRLVGAPDVVTATPADTAEMGRIVLDSAQLAALALDGPTVRSAEAALVAARAAKKAAKTPYMPTISTSYSLSGNNTSETFDWGSGRIPKQNSLRFSLNFPLFNNLSREENVTRATVAEENAVASLRDAKLAQQQSLVQFLGAFRTAEERVAIQLASVAAAEEDLRVQQQRYALGASVLLDLLTSQTTLDQARASLIQARYDARIAKAQVEALIGRDLK
ncbi:MAG: TolC family protein [Gemmatimonadaceae bacterium]|nr:TolC family protein [Gemmatimonadaceae bacterium]